MEHIVHIVDDDSRTRTATVTLLEGCGYRIEPYESGEDFLSRTPSDGCVVLKAHMQGKEGLDVHDDMISRGITLPVIFLDGDIPLAVRAMQRGAVDFIATPYDPDELVHSIERAFALAEDGEDARNHKGSAVAKLRTLTPRGLQVLQGLQAGMSNKEIARWLDLSPRTVEAYRATMMLNIGAAGISQAIRIALDGGLIQIDTDASGGKGGA